MQAAFRGRDAEVFGIGAVEVGRNTRITTLSFCFLPSDDDECLLEPPAESEVTIAGGTTYVIVKELRITLTGEVVADPSIVRSLRETVRVRNDEVVNPSP